MITKDTTEKAATILCSLGILAVGIMIGYLAHPANRHSLPSSPEKKIAAPPHSQKKEPASQTDSATRLPSNALETLYIDIAPAHAAKLQQTRDTAMARGLIIQGPDEMVPAEVRFGTTTAKSLMRIKGDFLDHISTHKWSLRVEMKDQALLGMSRFSIQHPKTRNYLWEWLIMSIARADGILAPRTMFINVVINGQKNGIYFLEEHFTKELLESQGRRDGPIVRFKDEDHWISHLQYRLHQKGRGPSVILPSLSMGTARAEAFGENRLARSEALMRQLQQALNQLRSLQQMVVARETDPDILMGTIQARLDTADKSISGIIDIEKAARMHALLALFRCNHALIWLNRRFYHNPLTARLEPIIYDTRAGYLLAQRDPIDMATPSTRALLQSTSYYHWVFRHLAELVSPEWLSGHLDTLSPEMKRYAAALRAEGYNGTAADPAYIANKLRDQQVYLRELLHPRVSAHFSGYFLEETTQRSLPAGEIMVEAWAATRVPVVVQAFRFGNGNSVTPKGSQLTESRRAAGIPSADGSFILPHDGRHVRFRFPVDEHFVDFIDLAGLKRAIRQNRPAPQGASLPLTIEYRSLFEDRLRTQDILIKRFHAAWSHEGNLPPPPSLEEALQRYPFLCFTAESGLFIKPGNWEVAGDLVLPVDHPLIVGPGVTLRFDPKAALITRSTLHFSGSASGPVVLGPKTEGQTWAGVAVLEARKGSTWQYVHVRNTEPIVRGGWILTGGTTFYRSPIAMTDCRFTGSRGEDAVNIIDTHIDLKRIAIQQSAGDALDGDGITGSIDDCRFRNAGGDTLDFSASTATIRNCEFAEIADKCISIGEGSTVTISGGSAENASLGIAVKDASHARIEDFSIRSMSQFCLAVYSKKPGFGASSLQAQSIVMDQCSQGQFWFKSPTS